jgi:hypothetical protein
MLSNNLLYYINTKLHIKSFYGRYVKGITNLQKVKLYQLLLMMTNGSFFYNRSK